MCEKYSTTNFHSRKSGNSQRQGSFAEETDVPATLDEHCDELHMILHYSKGQWGFAAVIVVKVGVYSLSNQLCHPWDIPLGTQLKKSL